MQMLAGILRDKKMADKLIYIPNAMFIHKITPSKNNSKWLKRWDSQLNKLTNQTTTKVAKEVKPTNKKRLLQNFGDYCNTQTMSAPSQKCWNIFKYCIVQQF